MSNIHPAAIIEMGAKIGKNVQIEAYAIVKKNVVLEDNVVIKSHAYIDGNTTIGAGTTVWPSASIGTKTQDLKFKGEITFVKIGKNCEIREFVTINSSCHENTVVEIGDNCLIMAYCHIAHNCKVGNGVIMANNAMLAGHVTIGDFANIGGMTAVHQHVRIGRHAMVGGFSRVTHDIPPFTIGAGVPYEVGGLNLVGLKRRGFALEDRMALTKAFKFTYRTHLRLEEALEQLAREQENSAYISEWIEFCRTSKRGLIDIAGATKRKRKNAEMETSEELLESSAL